MDLLKLDDKNLFQFFLIIIFLVSIISFFNIKYGSFTGISSSYLKLEEQIEKKGMVSDIFYEYKPITYISNNLSLTKFNVEGFSPYLPNQDLNKIIPSGYFLIDKNGLIGSKYPFYFSYITFFYKKSLNTEVFYFIPYISILFLFLFFLFLRNYVTNFYVLLGIISLLSSSILISLFTGRFIRELFSIFLVYFSYYLFYKYYQNSKWVYFYFGSFILGVASSVRITNILISIPILILLYKKVIDRTFYINNFKNILIGFSLFLIGLIPFFYQLSYPYIFLNKLFLPISGNINALSLSNLINSSRSNILPNWLVLFNYSLESIGYLIIVIILIYIIFKFKREKNKEVIISLFSIYICFLILFSSWVNPWPRYILVSIPVLYLLFIYSIKNLDFSRKIIKIIFIFILIITLLNLYFSGFNKTHYWSEIYDKDTYNSINNIDNYVDNNSLIIFESSNFYSGNQNLRGYIDATNKNLDIITLNNLDYLRNFNLDLNYLNYSSLYLLSNKNIFYHNNFNLIYKLELNSSNLNDVYYLYNINNKK